MTRQSALAVEAAAAVNRGEATELQAALTRVELLSLELCDD
jgi:hypothetical protein